MPRVCLFVYFWGKQPVFHSLDQMISSLWTLQQKLHLNPLKIPVVAAQHIQTPMPLESASVSCSTPSPALPPSASPSSPAPNVRRPLQGLCVAPLSSFCFHLSQSRIPAQVFICCEGFLGPFLPALPAVITSFSVCVFAAHILMAFIVHHVLVACPWSLRAVQSMADFCISGTCK